MTAPKDEQVGGGTPANGSPISIRPAGREAELFNDNVFSELRAYAQVPDDFVNEGWDLGQLQNGGGKGGTLMARVGSSIIVKELSPGDHKVLLAIAGSYGQHIRGADTLLCPIYLHFRDVASGRCFFAMRNGVGQGPFAALWDLKGCADDKLLEENGKPVPAVHKRIWNVGMWVSKSSWSEARVQYYNGKLAARSVDIVMSEEQREKFLGALRRDTQWLASHGLMDYSLLVASKEEPAGTSATGGSGISALGQRPIVRKGDNGMDISTSVVIIDFLQKWTSGKKVAMYIKCMESQKATVPPNAYAERFHSHFSQRFRAEEEARDRSPSRSVPAPVAPPAGDTELEGLPEDRLYSRAVPED
jgi:hypothetical protein